MKDPDCRPALAFKTADLTDYDVLIVGFPIWWGVAPRPVDTFLDSIQTDGKRVMAFCTSGLRKRLKTLSPATLGFMLRASSF